MLKRCDKCGAEKPATDFYRAQKRADGLQRRCKACQHADSARRAKADPEKHARYCREWARKNPDKGKEYRRVWAAKDYAENTDKWRKWQAEYAVRIAAELTPRYVAGLIAKVAGCRRADVPKEMIEAKRAVLLTQRLIMEKSK